MSARGKKSKATSGRGGRSKAMERQVSVDSVYGNHRFMQAIGNLVGLNVQVQTKTKEIYDGILSTFSPKFQMVVDWPHMASSPDTAVVINTDKVKKKIFFPCDDIVVVKVNSVDFDYATREGFATDSAISSKYNNGQLREKRLEPWTEGEADTEFTLSEENANGWDANEMFERNEKFYGVMTTYSPEMEGYTTPLQKRNTKEWTDKEAKAQKIAQEIQHCPITENRAELENGDDEEERFSAVIRSEQSTGKYMPPQRRKIQSGTGKLPPRVTPTPQVMASSSAMGGPPNSGRYTSQNISPTQSGSSYSGSNSNTSSVSNPPSIGANSVPSQHKHVPHPQGHKHGATSQGPPMGHGHSNMDTKLNGETKDTRRTEPPQDHRDTSHSKQDSFHSEYSHTSHQAQTYSSQQPLHYPSSSSDRQPEPKEQRKRFHNKDEQFAKLREFGKTFNLSEATTEQKSTPPGAQGGTATSTTHQTPPATQYSQAPPAKHQSQLPPSTPSQQSESNLGLSQSQLQQQPPVKQHTQIQSPVSEVQQTPPDGSTTAAIPPQPPVSRDSPGLAAGIDKAAEEKSSPPIKTMTTLNPDAKPFTPRIPSTATPPLAPTTQLIPSQPPQIATGAPHMNFPQNLLPAYAVMTPQPFQMQHTRYPKRVVGQPRHDFASPIQVANATGHPLLTPGPLPSISSPVQISQGMMPQANQYQQYSMLMRFPTPGIPMGIPMVTTVPTSMGMYHSDIPQNSQSHGHQPMFLGGPAGIPPHQSHPTPGHTPHPPQPPTPQGHNSGGPVPPHSMPAQPPTPGPTPPQTVMYGGPGQAPIAGQPTIPQHLAQHTPHPSQSPHSQYLGHNSAVAAHQGGHVLVIPPHLQSHMMPPGVPPPHSVAGHVPSSVTGYTSTSSAVVHPFNQGHHMHYLQGTPGSQGHHIPLVHHNQ